MSLNPFASAADALKDQKIGGEERDSLGGFELLATHAYDMTVKNFFQGASEKGAKYIVIEGVTADGKKLKFQEYVTNQKGEVTYEKDGEKFYLPGFNKMNSIAMLAARKELSSLTWEEKQVKIWNKAAGGEVLTPVPVAVDMLDKKITLGIFEQTVNQTEKQANGKYVPIHAGDNVPLVKDENVIDKAFDFETKKTIPELRAKAESAAFYKEWVEKFDGKKQDRVKTKNLVLKTGGGGAGAQPTNAAGGQTQAPEDNLFG